MAYFLQGYLPGDWITKLAFVELLMWVAMFSLIFLGRHENKDEIKRLAAVLVERDAEIAALKAQLPSDAEITPQPMIAANSESAAPASDGPSQQAQALPSSPSAAAPDAPGMRISKVSDTAA